MTRTTRSLKILTSAHFSQCPGCIKITTAEAAARVGHQVLAQGFHGAVADPRSEESITESSSEVYVSEFYLNLQSIQN